MPLAFVVVSSLKLVQLQPYPIIFKICIQFVNLSVYRMLFPIVAYPWLSTRLSLEIITGTHRYVNNEEGGYFLWGLQRGRGISGRRCQVTPFLAKQAFNKNYCHQVIVVLLGR